jgi:non-specific serine/threonine protein kinase
MIGQTLSHYSILDKLGEGGMGTVYLAEDTSLGRRVALKVLPSQMASDPDRLRRFKREAKTVAALSHPNIVTLYSVEESDYGHFITMELVEGESLEELIGAHGLSLEKIFSIAIPLADALSAAHRQGITHRDLKPANVMITGDGRVKILDFGLAKLQPESGAPEEPEMATLALTREGMVMGTVPYMSPEQVQGRRVDHRADIFSLGVLLYEMATGTRPFKGETSADLISSILRDAPQPVTEVNVDLPNHLGRVVNRCLEKDLQRRYQTALDVKNELEQLQKEGSEAGSEAMASIAVLPFADLSPEKDQDYFCEGLAEELINALFKIEGLRVASRASAFQIKDTVSDLREIGRRLNVETVLGGSVRKAGDRLRITAQLTKVADGYHMWSERYDRQLEDVFAIQDEISESIAQALKVTLGPPTVRGAVRAPKVDVQAYDLYLRGRKFFYQFRQQGFEFARQMFARAIVIDPSYARAYAGVADCCSFLYMYFDSSEENLKEADAASRKAVEIDPGSAEAHASRGLAVSLRKRFDEAKVEFETAIRLDAKNFDAHYLYARALLSQGKEAEAAEMFQRACEINPEDYQAPAFLAQSLQGMGREAKAEQAYRRGLVAVEKHLVLNPDDARAVLFRAVALSSIPTTLRCTTTLPVFSPSWAR